MVQFSLVTWLCLSSLSTYSAGKREGTFGTLIPKPLPIFFLSGERVGFGIMPISLEQLRKVPGDGTVSSAPEPGDCNCPEQ